MERIKNTGKEYQDLVAEIARSFDPGALIDSGVWVKGPDGRLDMDVRIRGEIDKKPILAVIECKDYNVKTTGKVGRDLIDALDSKRYDLNADIAIICSNSGFTEDALNKARRKGIGAISILKKDDERIKVVIEKEIYFRKIRIDNVTINIHGLNLDLRGKNLNYKGVSIEQWLLQKINMAMIVNPDLNQQIKLSFKIKPGIFLKANNNIKVRINTLEISFLPTTTWFSQIVQLDASKGIYNYLRGKVVIAPGQNDYIVKGINFETGKEIDGKPIIDRDFSTQKGEVDFDMVMFEGAVPTTQENTSLIDSIIEPEDLDLKFRN